MEEEKKEIEEEVQEMNPQTKKTSILMITMCLSLIIMLIVIGVASITAFSQMSDKPEEKKKTEVDKPVKKTAYHLSGNDIDDFDLYFLQIENKKTNMVYSPLSIKYALAMLNEGTAGDSHNQIATVIGDYKAKKYNNNEHMSFANAMFIRNTFQNQIKEDYKTGLQDNYGAEIITDSFNSADNVNSWISNKTFKLINNLLEDSTIQKEDFILVNALAIDMNWNYQLQCSLEHNLPCMSYFVSYHHEDYSDYISEIISDNMKSIIFESKEVQAAEIGVSVNKYDIVKTLGEDKIREEVGSELKEYIAKGGEMCGESYDDWMNRYIKELDSNYQRMDQSTDFSFYTDDYVDVFAKDLKTYENNTLQYVGIMPKQETLDEYIKDVKAKDINNLIKNLKEVKYDNFKEGVVTRIHANIPVFEYEYQLNLVQDLQKLGITDIFDINKADLSNMLEKDQKEYIGDATHKAVIEFSNDGIKAAAVTMMGGYGSAGEECYNSFEHKYKVPEELITLNFNKPYLYIIRDKETGEVWFTGTVYSPKEKKS
ncbi:MAG: hypothetical protein IKF71_04825 [Bacilli bacterium]|nr:hypothetical protein [Bacilli bacterium]